MATFSSLHSMNTSGYASIKLLFFVFCCITCPAYAQLEYVPKVSVEIKDSSRLNGYLLLTSKDFHVRHGAPNHNPSTLQVVDPKEPWPPVFIATLDPKFKDVEGYVFQDFRFQHAVRQFSLLIGAHPGAGYPSRYYTADTNFNIIDTVFGSTNKVDGHALVVNAKGERLYFTFVDTVLDISEYSKYPGDTAVRATIEVIEIIDRNGTLIWQWNPLHHIPIAESYQKFHDPSAYNPGSKGWDWAHGNSLSFSADGNILYSYRVLGVGKINRATGALMWKFGGKNPDIKMPKGGEYYLQHDFQEIAPGKYSLYSNGDEDHPHSRAIVYSIDEAGKSAATARVIEPATSLFSLSMGSYSLSESGLGVLNYGRYSTLETQQPAFEIVNEQNAVQAVYSMPQLVFPYRVELVESWKPRTRPQIFREEGMLKVSGFNSSVKWFEAKDGNVSLLSEQFNFLPAHNGTYIAITQAGFGWLVTPPYAFVK